MGRRVKEISTRRLNRKLLRSLESEIDVLRSCEHENIIALLDIVKDEPNQTVFLVLEHCALGDLSQYLRRVRRVAEPVARTFAAQIAGGLREMRARNLIHRDLKPQNLLLCRTPATDVRAEVKSGTASEKASLGSEKDASYTSATLKIADFGFARYVHPSGLAETLCGSPLYMAPEILSYQKYDAKADLWSVGCILFEHRVRAPPFAGANPMALLRNITRGDARIPGCVAGELSRECVDLMRGLLQKDPARRMSHEQFFEHPFLKTNVRARRRDEKAPESFPKTESPRFATLQTREIFTAFTAPDSDGLRADSDSDSDASESSETLAASDPRAIALGTDGGAEKTYATRRDPRDALESQRGAPRRTRRFSAGGGGARARQRRPRRARGWGVAARTEKGGSTFSKLVSSSPLSARKGMGLSGRSPRSPRRRAMPSRRPSRRLSTRTRRMRWTPSTCLWRRRRGVRRRSMPRSIPKRYVRDPSPNPTSRTRGGETQKTQKTQKTKKASSRSPRRAPKIRACAARRASSAPRARSATPPARRGTRASGWTPSRCRWWRRRSPLAAAPRLGDESPKREGAEGDAGGIRRRGRRRGVAPPGRRVRAALRRAEARGERRGNDVSREKLEF